MTAKRLQATLFGVTNEQADVLRSLAELWNVVYSDGELPEPADAQ